jgi:putative hydrolase of the HAD superfamily
VSADPAARVVLWDADGVLQRVPDGWEESMRPALEGRLDDVDGFLAQAFGEERSALTGEVRWLEVLPGLLDRWGVGDAYDEVLTVWLTIEEVPGARDLVRALRSAGVRCYLASNQDEHRGRHMHRRLGYADLLDGAFYSYRLGLAKPDPAYFARIVEELGATPDDLLFVDDNLANVESARTVGLRAEAWSYREPLGVLRDHLTRHGLPVG